MKTTSHTAEGSFVGLKSVIRQVLRRSACQEGAFQAAYYPQSVFLSELTPWKYASKISEEARLAFIVPIQTCSWIKKLNGQTEMLKRAT